MKTLCAGVLALVALLAGGSALAQAPTGGATMTDSTLEQSLAAIAAAHHGRVALYARQLNTGKTVALDADTPVPTASVIKLTLLYEAMEEIRAGKAHWDEKLTLKAGDGVNGSGVLYFFDTPLTLTLKDVATMMVIQSDNTATNLMIDRFTTAAVNQRITELGLKNTWLYKKISKPAVGPMPADQPKFGLGKTTAREMAMVMERITRCELGGPAQPGDDAICHVVLEMLRNQFYRNAIPRYLETIDTSENGSAIGNKTGSLNKVRNDVAVIGAKSGPMIISIFTYDNADQSWTADNEAEMTISKLAKAIVQAWSPEGLDAKEMVPGLGLPAPPGRGSEAK
jgi:beta-lactamase class A